MQILVFIIDGRKYALDLKIVQRILLAVQYTPIPGCPEYVLGAVNMHGEIIPVINMRMLLGLANKDISMTDNLILCELHEQKVALLVDQVEQVKFCEEVISNNASVKCILKEEEEITLLCDMNEMVPQRLILVG
jgi:purine-binding chemotaxis protein CheW